MTNYLFGVIDTPAGLLATEYVIRGFRIDR